MKGAYLIVATTGWVRRPVAGVLHPHERGQSRGPLPRMTTYPCTPIFELTEQFIAVQDRLDQVRPGDFEDGSRR